MMALQAVSIIQDEIIQQAGPGDPGLLLLLRDGGELRYA